MGGFCGVISSDDCVSDLFFGTDYHSHLGTHRGGMAVLGRNGFQRSIHNIQNAPFRSKFEQDVGRFAGNAGIGVISDTDPQPLVMCSRLGTFAIVTVGLIANIEDLKKELFGNAAQLQYSTTSGMVGPTEVVSALIATQNSIVEGVRYVQRKIEGSCSMLIATEDGRLFAVRDRYGRTPVVLGRREGATIALMESCALPNLGYTHVRDLGPGEMVELSPDGDTTVIEPGEKMAICSFLWVYYGYPASSYEGRNVEMARYRCGSALAKRDVGTEFDAACGIPDSGTSHALGYAHEARIKYARPFVKYTPTWARSFMPGDQRQRERVAAMKLIPIPGLIRDRRLVFCDDSIVRGTQLGKQADRLYAEGCREVNVRIACPPLLFPCRFINFSRSKNEYDLITRRYIRGHEGEGADISKYIDPTGEPYKGMVEYIRKKLNLTSLAFQTVDDLVAAIGLPKDRLCTYCWTGEDVSCAHGCAGCPHAAASSPQRRA